MENPLRHTTYQGTSVPTGKGRSNSSERGQEQPPDENQGNCSMGYIFWKRLGFYASRSMRST